MGKPTIISVPNFNDVQNIVVRYNTEHNLCVGDTVRIINIANNQYRSHLNKHGEYVDNNDDFNDDMRKYCDNTLYISEIIDNNTYKLKTFDNEVLIYNWNAYWFDKIDINTQYDFDKNKVILTF